MHGPWRGAKPDRSASAQKSCRHYRDRLEEGNFRSTTRRRSLSPTMAPGRNIEDDFVLTIDSDDDVPAEADTHVDIATSKKRKRGPDDTKSKKQKVFKPNPDAADDDDENAGWTDHAGEQDGALDSEFEFEAGADADVTEDFDGWFQDTSKSTAAKGVDMDVLIARRKPKRVIGLAADAGEGLGDDETMEDDNETDPDRVDDEDDEDDEATDGFGMGVPLGEGSDSEAEQDSPGDDDDDDESEIADDMDAEHPMDDQSDGSDQEEEDAEEKAKQEAFFAPEEKATPDDKTTKDGTSSFQTMSLSRPILRGLASIGFSIPTPIQAKTIPVALMGKDVVGGAVTGSGKTAAFMIPILERLLYRPKKVPTSRVAILMPTRELAVQCFNVAKKLASFTDITFCQLVGGFSLREQENILKQRPDVIIATPGRFIDHMRNSASFTIDTLEILVLDEADRMLEEGFSDELNEILTTIPRSRQTMLFSATMTNTVDKLIRVGLNRPVRLMVDAQKQTVGTLTQEFVRLRPGREDKRLAVLMYLCTNVFRDRCIIFFRQKKEAHRVRIIFGLCGFKVAELHGSLSQEQRISSVEAFRAGTVTHLLATDVASRGLDIKGVDSVINYEAPQSHEIYLHRVGRTARAGRTGRACTIAAETDRRVVKAAVRSGKTQGAKIVSRVVEQKIADDWASKIVAMEPDVEDLIKEEKEEKQMQSVEMQVRKGENMIQHENEILARPKRDWFQTAKDKLTAKQAGIDQLNGVANKKKKLKLSNKDKKKLDDTRERKEERVWKKGKDQRGLRSLQGTTLKGKDRKVKDSKSKMKAKSKKSK